MSIKLPASGKVERLRQKESRGNCPLVVAADTGLTSGEGVIPAMIGGQIDSSQGTLHSNFAACAVVQPRYRHDVRYAEAAEGVDSGVAG